MATTEEILSRIGTPVPEAQASSRLSSLEARLQDNLVMRTRDGGRIYQTASGLMFVSDRFSSIDQEEIRRIMRQESAGGPTPSEMIGQEMSARQSMQTGPGALAATTLKASQGIPFAGEFIPEAIGTVSPGARTQMETTQRVMEEEAPGLSMAARGVGALGPSLLIPGAATTGGVLAQGARGAALAGAEATVSGAGAAEGDLIERGTEGLQQGGIAALIGGPLSGAFALLSRGVGGRRGFTQAVDKIAEELGVSKGAAMIIGQTVQRNGSIDEAVANIRRAGDQGMIADANIAIASLLDAVIATGGEAADVGRGAVVSRATQQRGLLGEALDETLGEAPVGMRTVRDEAYQRTQSQRNELYDEAYRSPIDYTSEAGDKIEAVIARIPQDRVRGAIKDANDLMQLEGYTDRQIKARILPNGRVVFEEQPNVIQLDFIKQALQNEAYKNTDNFGNPMGVGVKLNQVASQLRDAVSEAVPAYGRAVKVGGDTIREVQAGRIGSVIFSNRTTVEDVMSAVENASETEINALMIGARNQIREIMDNAKGFISAGSDADVQAARALLRDLSSTSSQQKLRLIMPEEQFATLNAQLQQSRAALELLANTAPNSRTAIRQELVQQMDEILEPGPIGRLMRGEPLASGQEVIQALTGMTDQAVASRRQQILTEIATALTQKRGRTAEEALRLVDSAMRGGRLSDAQAQIVNRALQTISLPLVSEGTTASMQ